MKRAQEGYQQPAGKRQATTRAPAAAGAAPQSGKLTTQDALSYLREVCRRGIKLAGVLCALLALSSLHVLISPALQSCLLLVPHTSCVRASCRLGNGVPM